MLVFAQQTVLPSEPPRGFGASVTGAFEGWFENPDGTYSFLIGYLNRNRQRPVDVPIGPNNRIDANPPTALRAAGPDMGQPTHFLPGRRTGMFIITVPKEFSREHRLIWTIVVNGVSNSIPLRLHTDYNVSPLKIQYDTLGYSNTPPQVRFVESGTPAQAPLAAAGKVAHTLSASVGAALPLPIWAEDDAAFSSGSNAPMADPPPPPVEILWSKYRGPGDVTFDNAEPKLEVLAGGKVNQPFRGRGTATAKFSAPGEYLLHVLASDYSGDGGGGEVCCWTTAIVKVTVTP
jgi:hypothetical protein